MLLDFLLDEIINCLNKKIYINPNSYFRTLFHLGSNLFIV